jgi:ferrous iron transport protein A
MTDFPDLTDDVCPIQGICPLTKAPIGQDLRLCKLCGGRRMARRLAELGLTPGVHLRVVQDAGGPLLVSVRDSRVALGRGIASKLSVEVL